MLTAKGQEMDKVTGLESGADDYLTKPFGVKELLARVHALLRRACGHLTTTGSDEFLTVGECRIDVANHLLERDGQSEILTPKELCLIQCLHRHRGKALTRDQLLNEVWGVQYFGTTRTLDQTVAQVRRKIGDSGSTPRWIVTVHGVGYRLNQ
jgi:DNA-binding response OmpR family regulator